MKTCKLILSVFLTVFMTGCIIDNWKEGQEDDSLNVPGNGFVLNYTIVNSTTPTKSTIQASNDENTIHSLFVLFFEYSESGIGKYKGIYEVDIPDNGAWIGETRDIPLDFDPIKHDGLSKHEDYVLLVCANLENYLETGSQSITDYFAEELQGNTENYAIEGIFVSLVNHSIPADELPMSARTVKKADEETAYVDLDRCVARFDVVNNDDRYELVTVSIWNVFPHTTLWPSRFNSFDNVTRYNDATGTHGAVDKGFDTVEPYVDELGVVHPNKTIGELYAFENYVIAPGQNDVLTTCLVIGLKHVITGSLTYHRVNINSTQLGQHLKRNNMYKTIINRVIGEGELTEKDAFKGGKFLLDVDINNWSVDDNGSIQFDGENILAVPSTKAVFSPTGTTEEGGKRDYSIFTYGSAKLEISKESLPEGISATLNQSNILSFVVEASELDKEGYIELSFGNLKTVVSVIQTGKTSEFLELSMDVNEVPAFPAKPTSTNNGSGPISISSSGPCTAIIHGSDPGVFSFSQSSGSGLDPQYFNDGDAFEVFIHDDRLEPNPRYGFVLITLDSNPSITRVLVLMQNGSGGVSLTPTDLTFDVFGINPNTQDNSWAINVNANDGTDRVDWNLSPRSGDLDKFDVTINVSGDLITVKSKGENTTNHNYSATYRVMEDGHEGIFKEFTVTQNHHELTVDPKSNFGTISVNGGYTTNINVTSSAKWKAIVTTDIDDKAYFYGTNKLTEIEGNTGESFRIAFDKLTVPLKQPVATVKVVVLAVDGVTETDMTTSFTVNQAQLPFTDLILQTNSNSYGSMTGTNDYGKYLREAMRNTLLINKNGPIYMPTGYTFVANTSTPEVTSDIFQIVHTEISNSATQTSIKNWWNEGKDGKVLFITADNTIAATLTGIVGNGYKGTNNAGGSVSGENGHRFLSSEKLNRKVTNYLLQDGPFTNGQRLDLSTTRFADNSTYTAVLAGEYPDTFVPIIATKDGDIVFGIDPSLKLIIIGAIEMYGGNGSRSSNTDDPNVKKFWNNFLAWMTYAAMYGDAFTEQFID